MEKKRILISAYAFNPMRSLQLFPREDTMGWKIVEQISREYDVWVLTHSYNREGVLEALSRREMPGVNIHFLELPSFFWKLCKKEFGRNLYYYLWQRSAWKKAVELHQDIGFHLAHHLTLRKAWPPSFIGFRLPVSFIWGPLEARERFPKGLSREYSIHIPLVESIRRSAQWMGRRSPAWMKCVKKARMILVNNQGIKGKIPKRYHKKVRYFPNNGIERDDIRVKPVKMRKQKKFRVITLGGREYFKDLELAAKAFLLFTRDNPNAEMTIVGEGLEKERIEKLLEEMNLRNKVTIQDRMERIELLKQMRISDVFLYPSFYNEGNTSVVDAMASGLPVICLNTAEPGFHVQEKWGIKIKPTSSDFVVGEMAKALSRLNNNEKLRAQMGESARKRAKEYYEWKQLGKRILDIYSQILS